MASAKEVRSFFEMNKPSPTVSQNVVLPIALARLREYYHDPLLYIVLPTSILITLHFEGLPTHPTTIKHSKSNISATLDRKGVECRSATPVAIAGGSISCTAIVLKIRFTREETEYIACCLSESYGAMKLARCSGLEKTIHRISPHQAVDRPVG